MQITQLKINLKNNEVRDNSLLATASITLDDAIVIRGIRILNGRESNKVWIAMSAAKQPNGNYHEYYHPINDDFRNMISATIINAYNSVLENPDKNIIKFDVNPDPINITRTKIYIINNAQNIKAAVSIILDDKFILEQMHIIKKKDTNELFFAMPRRKLPDGTYMEIFHPANKKIRELLTNTAFNAYDSVIRN